MKIFISLLCLWVLSFQIACTGQESFQSNGQGFAGRTEPTPADRRTANYTNSKSKCALTPTSSNKQLLSCQIYVFSEEGEELGIATETGAGVLFTWSFHSGSTVDSSSFSTCSTSNDSLSFTCEINSSSITESLLSSVVLQITENDQVRTQAESVKLEALATSSPTPNPAVVVTDPHSANVVLLLKMDGASGSAIVDSKGKTVNNFGAEISDSPSKYGTGGGFFSGTAFSGFHGGDDYLTIPSSTDFNFDAGDFTIETFVNFRQVGSYNRLITRWDNPLRNWKLVQQEGDWKFFWSTSGADESVLSFPHATAINRWYHIAVSRNGGTLRMYLDGVLVASSAISGNVAASGQSVLVGKLNNAEAPQFLGSLNYLRVTKGIGRYNANFSIPTLSDF